MSAATKSPFPVTGARTTAAGQSNPHWWPERLNLKILSQHSAKTNPMEPQFDYATEFRKLDYAELNCDRASGKPRWMGARSPRSTRVMTPSRNSSTTSSPRGPGSVRPPVMRGDGAIQVA